MKLLARHLILVSGETANEAEARIRDFFGKTSLVRYDRLDVRDTVLSAGSSAFKQTLDSALSENRRLLAGFIEELGQAGCSTRQDLAELAQGYQSKILHIVAHFLDGFIGIDSAFYNLVDDSHWLTDETAVAIAETPERYWLFSLDGYSMTPREAALLHT